MKKNILIIVVWLFISKLTYANDKEIPFIPDSTDDWPRSENLENSVAQLKSNPPYDKMVWQQPKSKILHEYFTPKSPTRPSDTPDTAPASPPPVIPIKKSSPFANLDSKMAEFQQNMFQGAKQNPLIKPFLNDKYAGNFYKSPWKILDEISDAYQSKDT